MHGQQNKKKIKRLIYFKLGNVRTRICENRLMVKNLKRIRQTRRHYKQQDKLKNTLFLPTGEKKKKKR
jgi:hypothetical protein